MNKKLIKISIKISFSFKILFEKLQQSSKACSFLLHIMKMQVPILIGNYTHYLFFKEKTRTSVRF